MSITQSMFGVLRDFQHFFWPAKHWLRVVRLGALFLVILIAGRFLLADAEPAIEAPSDTAQLVTLVTPAEVTAREASAFVGTVRAVSEAQIQNEVAGRVTAVAVRPGDEIGAGAVVATLENSAQRAAVLQAEGAYESALAAAAQSETGVESAQASLEQAQNTAVTAVQSAASSYSNVLLNTIDVFFANPSTLIPGVRIDSSQTPTLNSGRVALQDSLSTLTSQANALTTEADLATVISSAESVGAELLILLDILITDVQQAAASDTLAGQPVSNYGGTLATARSTVVSNQGSLTSARTGLTQAEAALLQAEQAGLGSDTVTSAADAQVKSALGSLRAAQAQLSKTILRTPIAGTVNDVAVNAGDFIGAFTQVAEVANNGSLEVAFFVTEAEALSLLVGQELQIGSASGTIVSIAPAVNQATQKTEVRATVSDSTLTNGSSVTVRPVTSELPSITDETVWLPLTAVRFTATDGSVFVVENETLVLKPVTLGRIKGSTVEITSGVTFTEAVVADARGLTVAQTVTVAE